MFNRQLIAIALLGATAGFSHAQDAATDPQSGKKCVTFMSSETTPTGQTRMVFRNTCASPFRVQVQVPLGNRTRETNIEAGTADKPSKAYVNCRADERCEAAKWTYEATTAS
jgi:hypothetical protein